MFNKIKVRVLFYLYSFVVSVVAIVSFIYFFIIFGSFGPEKRQASNVLLRPLINKNKTKSNEMLHLVTFGSY